MDVQTAKAIALAHQALVEMQHQLDAMQRHLDLTAAVVSALDDVVTHEHPMLAAEVVQFPRSAS